ncbi:MmgE/PrpD family protein [Sinorhizobium sp. Sb3]|uniref:MmgE/PrpD family protein n=1 Tax=Sinorhizobium sp. Sb3 TaxID=1358417 RepID=UPI0018D25A16|nr:MmgE/PrpD family protein [Sinorhizobium sp. Sb3]
MRKLATYIVEERDAPLPTEVNAVARKCIVDALIAASVGVNSSGPTAIRKTAASLYPGKSPIWFTDQASSFIGAAWANSAAIAALDLDDGEAYARGHPGAAVISTAFAVGTDVGASYEDIIRAIVIGYQVGVIVGAARKTYGNTGTWSPYAVVATAGALRKSSREHLEHAMAIAGESAPNQSFMSLRGKSPVPEGSDVKEGIPWSVRTGLDALITAENGHTGPRNILDCFAHYAFPEGFRVDSEYRILKTYFKPYACCRHIHAAIAGMRDVIVAHGIEVSSITAVEVETNYWAASLPNKTQPENLSDIQYSIPYCLALVAIVGNEAFVPLTKEALGLKEAEAFAESVKVIQAGDIPIECASMETPARVTVVCSEGSMTSQLKAPEWGAADQPSFENLIEKFNTASRFMVRPHRQAVEHALHALWKGDMHEAMKGLETNIISFI